jgi:hypothetical protein
MPVTKANLDDVFSYHPPSGQQPTQYARVREAAKAMADVILENTPNCADQQAALRHLREAVMTANAAIALNGIV